MDKVGNGQGADGRSQSLSLERWGRFDNSLCTASICSSLFLWAQIILNNVVLFAACFPLQNPAGWPSMGRRHRRVLTTFGSSF